MLSVDYSAIGRRIKERRKELHFTQVELADRVGLSGASISKYEHGKVEDATQAMLTKIAEALDVPVAWLLGLEVSEPVRLTEEEAALIAGFRTLNREGKDYLMQTLSIAQATYKEEARKVKRA